MKSEKHYISENKEINKFLTILIVSKICKNFYLGEYNFLKKESFFYQLLFFFVILHSQNVKHTIKINNQKNTKIMTKAEIVASISDKTGIEKVAVLAVVEEFMTTVKDAMISGENVYLRGFGSFIIKRRAEKTGRNISKNTSVIVPAHNIPAFKPAKTFLNEVKDNVK